MRPSPNLGPNVPAFLKKLWKIVNDPTIDDLVGWSEDGESFVIRNPPEFCYNLLPIYYKHNNMSSFIRQLNMYGFHKVSNENGCDKDEIRFFHPFFQQDQARLLQHIKRKIGSTKPSEDKKIPLDHIGKVLSDVKSLKGKQESVDSQLSTIKQENAALWRELALLRQKHMKQQQIVNKLIHFLVSLVQQPSRTTIGVKRRFPLMINDGPSTKAIRRSERPPTDGATIQEIDSSTTEEPHSEVLIDDVPDVPTVTSPLAEPSSIDTSNILDNILVDTIDTEMPASEALNNETSVAELLQDSEEIDFPPPDLEEVITADLNPSSPDMTVSPDLLPEALDKNVTVENIGEDLNELDQVVQTPQVMLSSDGKSIINMNPFSDNKIPEKGKQIAEVKSEFPTKNLAVAMRNNPQEYAKLLNADEFGFHVTNTQGELESIRNILFEEGLTLDANAFLDLFPPSEGLCLDVNQKPEEEEWPSSSANDNQLFSGSELISYNPNDVLNFDNLLEENQDSSQLN